MASLTLTGGGPSAGSAGFSPAQLSGLTGWWDATSLGLNDGDAVSSWSDSAGLANAFTQATGAKQPLYKTNITNGKPIVRFDGTDDYLDSTTLFGNIVSSSLSIFGIVCDRNPVTNRDFLTCRGQGWFVRVQINTFTYVHTGYAGQVSQGVSLTGFHQFGITRAAQSGGTNAVLQYWDGTVSSAGALTGYDVSAGPTRLGATPATGAATGFSPADIGELIFLNTVPDATTRQQIETYLRTKWGTP